jgi:hypothetical protein
MFFDKSKIPVDQQKFFAGNFFLFLGVTHNPVA